MTFTRFTPCPDQWSSRYHAAWCEKVGASYQGGSREKHLFRDLQSLAKPEKDMQARRMHSEQLVNEEAVYKHGDRAFNGKVEGYKPTALHILL